MKKKRIVAAFAVLVMIACILLYEAGGLASGKMTRYTATFLDVFDTQTEVVGYAASKEDFFAQAELLKEKLTYYHDLYDIYHDHEGISNIKTINDNAGIAPVVVDQEIIDLLKFSKEMYEQTNGQVNVAMGSVLSIWHDHREQALIDPDHASLPSMEKLTEASAHTDISQMVIDEAASTVFLKDKEMSLDVGGIAKGYAVQKVAEYAREIGMEHVLISVGGNVCAVGGKIDDSEWRLGIQDPKMSDEMEYVQKVAVKNKCVVTSGNYQRYFVVDGERYCHIIDPDTLMPADYFASVSIITDDSGKADALSTAIYNMPLEEGIAFVNGMENVEALWIMEDGSMHYSEHFQTYLAE